MITLRNRGLLLAFLLCASVAFLHAQNSQFQLSNWQTYTSLLTVRGACVASNNTIWAGTSGGVFSYNIETNDVREFRNTNGLVNLDVTSIAYSAQYAQVFVGTFDGVISSYHEGTDEWTHYRDVQQASTQYSKRQINQIIFKDSVAYIATDFGVLLFDVSRGVFLETIDRIADFQLKTPVRKLTLNNDSLYVATDAGLAVAPLSARSLRNPSSWRRIPYAGTTDRPFIDICFVNNRLYACTDERVWCDSAATTLSEIQVEGGGAIVSIEPWKNTLAIVRTKSMHVLQGSIAQGVHTSDIAIADASMLQAQPIMLLGYSKTGLGIFRGDSLMRIQLNTPLSNRVRDVTVDTKGNVWFATSNGNTDGTGFCALINGEWKNYSTLVDASMKSDNFFKIGAGANGAVVVGNWGDGLALATTTNDSITVRYYNNSNSPFVGIKGGEGFVLVSESVADNSGNTWIINYDPTNGPGPSIVRLDANGAFKAYTDPNSANPRSYQYLTIDANGTKWMGSNEGGGIKYFNDRNTPDNLNDDIWGRVTSSTSSSFPSDNSISALVADKSGNVWIGTTSGGIVVMYSTFNVISNRAPVIRKLSLLNTQIVNDIVVDALNNKWIATNTGVWVLNEDGTEVLGYFHAKNSPLLSDEVRTIATDENTGTMFIGTLNGLNAVSTLSLKAVESYNITIAPQPYNVHNGECVIEGLEKATSINIIGVDGSLVRKITTQSRRAVWDGKTDSGVTVSNGVYIVLAVSSDNSTSAVAKIVVKQ